MQYQGLVGIALTLTALISTSVSGGDEEPAFFSFDIENDIHVFTDRHYTSGVRLSWTSPADKPWFNLDDVAEWFPFFDSNDTIRSVHSIGHYIFTPNVITTPNPDPTDRPYAGWLNLETGLIAQGAYETDIIVFGLGVTGDPSLGRWGQRRIHEIISSPEPLGWDTQIPTEPTFQLTYHKIWQPEKSEDYLGTGLEFDVQPRLTLAAGTVFVYADLGAMVRLGNNLSNDLGPTRNSLGFVGSDYFEPADKVDWYVFAGVQGRYIPHNLFLDGGVFRDFDRTVPSRRFVGDFQTGVVFTFGSWRLSGFNTIRTQEFRGQGDLDIYGGLQLTFQY